ncbi:hypothetical protein ABZ532_06700 [Streptomyces sp. NPDC019396]|uniref:hypothetical protein n=1 Tax=Streptomyces sp. NPDC019396 TaxID=3154687 RepID=UPI0033D7965F
MKPVRPLGILSHLEGQQFYAHRKAEMIDQANSLSSEERHLIASYMRKGSVVLAIMEHTTDIVDSRFERPGGSGIFTDGEFYWRGDAADYVEAYGVSPGQNFIHHVHERNGEPPTLTLDEIIEIDDYFVAMRRSGGK